MAEISRAKLFGKLNSLGYKSMEGATVFCKLRGNPYVEVAHFLHQVLQLQDSDLRRILRHFGINSSRLAADPAGGPVGRTAAALARGRTDVLIVAGWAVLIAAMLYAGIWLL